MTETSRHRLRDMVIEEVSLVDRAANKQRFLIVKRSDGMEEDLSKDEAVDNTEAAEPEESAPQADVSETPEGDETTDDLDDDTAEEQDDLDTAVQALEELTAAIESLSGTNEQQVQTKLAELGSRLKQIAERFEQQRDDAETEKTPAPDPGFKEHIESLTRAVNTLAGLFKEQQKRISRMEKRFGLPNSLPTSEKAPKKSHSDSWPMDLNCPVDRQSVDKAVSFHEL